MWFFYSPKLNSRKFGFKPRFQLRLFKRFYGERKYDLNELSKLISIVFFFLFLIIACRVGLISVLHLFDYTGYDATINSKAIWVPKAENSRRWEGSGRHNFVISIHKDGQTRINRGQRISPENFEKLFEQKKFKNPQIRAFLVIDRRCKMNYVYQVLGALKKVNIRRVLFFTGKSDKTYL